MTGSAPARDRAASSDSGAAAASAYSTSHTVIVAGRFTESTGVGTFENRAPIAGTKMPTVTTTAITAAPPSAASPTIRPRSRSAGVTAGLSGSAPRGSWQRRPTRGARTSAAEAPPGIGHVVALHEARDGLPRSGPLRLVAED